MSEEKDIVWLPKSLAKKVNALDTRDSKAYNDVIQDYIDASKREIKANVESLEEDVLIYKAAMIKANEIDETKSVRPTEANHEIDPENEHEKEKIDEEEKQRQKNRQKKYFDEESKKDDEEEEKIISSHILDLKG